MQTHPFDTLTLDNGAKIFFTPCPGTKEAALNDSVATLKQAGATTLVTLMFDEEMAVNQAQSLPQECEKQGINWLQLPIHDDAQPDEAFETQWQAHQAFLLQELANKGGIAVHCKGGSGRTGLVIGLILLAMGWPSAKVIEQVQHIRPKALKNPQQLAYFNSYI